MRREYRTIANMFLGRRLIPIGQHDSAAKLNRQSAHWAQLCLELVPRSVLAMGCAVLFVTTSDAHYHAPPPSPEDYEQRVADQALLMATEAGRLDLVRYALRHGASIEAKDRRARHDTALILEGAIPAAARELSVA